MSKLSTWLTRTARRNRRTLRALALACTAGAAPAARAAIDRALGAQKEEASMQLLPLVQAIQAVVAVAGACVIAAERPGDGAAKKAEAVAAASALVAALPIPGWAQAVFGNMAVLGILIDLVVARLHRTGEFAHVAPAT